MTRRRRSAVCLSVPFSEKTQNDQRRHNLPSQEPPPASGTGKSPRPGACEEAGGDECAGEQEHVGLSLRLVL